MKNRYFVALALAGVVSFAACSSSNDNAAPSDEPVVTDTTPAATAPAMTDTTMAPMDTGAVMGDTAAMGADTTM